MPGSGYIQPAVIACLAVFVLVGVWHRIKSQIGGESLDRTREGWPILIGIRLMGILGMIQTVLILARPSALDWARVPLPLSLRWIGVLVFAAAVALLCWMFVSLGRNLTDTVVTRTNATLVEHGPYRYIRNPMYSGLVLFGAGFGLAMENVSIPATLLVVFSLFVIRTRTEEKYLIARFGDRYRSYMRRVGRFVPGIH